MTTKLEQVARQALEALEVSTDWDICAKGKQLQSMKAITALREALTEQALSKVVSDEHCKGLGEELHKLAEQTEQEPVAWGRVFDGDTIDCICPEEHALNEGDYTIPLYAAPVRTKDLTDDEILEADNCSHGNTEWTKKKAFARAVIAADREKNK